MNDPERLLDRADSLDARLLSAMDEPAPPDLLARTLATVGAAAVVPVAVIASAGGKAVATKAAAGGILSAICIGALAGVATVGAISLGGFVASGQRVAVPSVAMGSPVQAPRGAPSVAMGEMLSAPETPARAIAANGQGAPSSVPVVSVPPSTSAFAAGSTKARGGLAMELELLDDARRALDSGDLPRARALMDRYAREVPHGQLAREGALLDVEVRRAAAATNP